MSNLRYVIPEVPGADYVRLAKVSGLPVEGLEGEEANALVFINKNDDIKRAVFFNGPPSIVRETGSGGYKHAGTGQKVNLNGDLKKYFIAVIPFGSKISLKKGNDENFNTEFSKYVESQEEFEFMMRK